MQRNYWNEVYGKIIMYFRELFFTLIFLSGDTEVVDNLLLEESSIPIILVSLKMTDIETFRRSLPDYLDWKEGKSLGRSFRKIEINILAGKLL
jgi:hypothetical protein